MFFDPVVDGVYHACSVFNIRFQQYFKSVIYCFLDDLFQYLFLDFSYVLIGERRFQIL